MITSSKDVTRLESFGNELRLSVNCTNKLSYIPGEIFLENTFTSHTKLIAKCIESWFCGDRLPTSIINRHVIICHSRNQIAVKINRGSVSFLVNRYLSVTRFPVDVRLNCGTHLGFDLTHLGRLKRVCDVVGCCPLHSYKIHDFGGLCQISGQFPHWHNSCCIKPPLNHMLVVLSQSHWLTLAHSALHAQIRGVM